MLDDYYDTLANMSDPEAWPEHCKDPNREGTDIRVMYADAWTAIKELGLDMTTCTWKDWYKIEEHPLMIAHNCIGFQLCFVWGVVLKLFQGNLRRSL